MYNNQYVNEMQSHKQSGIILENEQMSTSQLVSIANYLLLISVIPQTPTLSVAPSDATIESGTSVTVTCATASTGASITYNFLKDGNAVTSQASGTYTMGSITTAESGSYTCTVTMSTVTSVASSGHTTTVVGEYMVKIESTKCIVKVLNPIV